MAGYWLKLYTEILDDPKYHKLSDSGRLGLMELLLVAKRYGGDNGEIPGVEDTAFYTRRSVEWWEPVLDELKRIKFIVEEGDKEIIRKWAERQGPVPGAERAKYSRNVRNKERFVDVTSACDSLQQPYDSLQDGFDSYGMKNDEKLEPFDSHAVPYEKNGDTDTDTDTETEKRERKIEKNSEKNPPPPLPSYSWSQAPGPYMEIYSRVTGQVAIPGGELDKVIPALDGIMTKFRNTKEVVNYLKPYYQKWISQRTKDNRPYPRHKCVWLYDWAVGEMPLDEKIPEVKKKVRKPDPNCPKCNGMGLVTKGGKVGDSGFGKLVECSCVKEVENADGS